jgi:hypothetical protein
MGNVLALIVSCCAGESLLRREEKETSIHEGSGHGGVVTKLGHV